MCVYIKNKKKPKINAEILKSLKISSEKRIVITKVKENETYIKSSYSYIKDADFKNLAILNIPYEENSDFYNQEAENFLTRYAQVFIIMFIISILISYLLSSNITKSISQISEKLGIVIGMFSYGFIEFVLDIPLVPKFDFRDLLSILGGHNQKFV